MLDVKTYSQSIEALGSTVTCTVAMQTNQSRLDTLFSEVWMYILNFEKKYSRFLESSELTRVNNLAGTDTYIDDEFEQILRTTKKLAIESDGLFNPFILPALQKVGYKNSFLHKYSHEQSPDYSNRTVSTIESLKISKNIVQIPKNSALDLGGIGKGYVADYVLNCLRSSGAVGGWVSVGGDVAGFGKDDNDKNWNIEIQDANNTQNSLCSLSLVNKFNIASSGTITRKGVNNSRSWHHVIDPSTLLPTRTDIRLVTVLSDSTTTAEVYAKILLVAGSDKAIELSKKYNIRSVLVQYIKNSEIAYRGYGELYKVLQHKKEVMA